MSKDKFWLLYFFTRPAAAYQIYTTGSDVCMRILEICIRGLTRINRVSMVYIRG